MYSKRAILQFFGYLLYPIKQILSKKIKFFFWSRDFLDCLRSLKKTFQPFLIIFVYLIQKVPKKLQVRTLRAISLKNTLFVSGLIATSHKYKIVLYILIFPSYKLWITAVYIEYKYCKLDCIPWQAWYIYSGINLVITRPKAALSAHRV